MAGYEEKATNHIKKMRHAAVASATGWTCIEIGCDASGGDMRKPKVSNPNAVDDNSWTYDEFWNLF